jgi:MFS family permease
MVVTAVTSLLLPLFEGEIALITIYGLAGFGVAAFTPSALSLVGDAAAPGRAAMFAWYTTAHYGAIAVGPFLGGLAAMVRGIVSRSSGAPSWSPRLWCSAWPACTARPGWWWPTEGRHSLSTSGQMRTWSRMDRLGRGSPRKAWCSCSSRYSRRAGACPCHDRAGISRPRSANTLARFPAGWLVDRTGRCTPFAVGGVLIGSVVTAFLPNAIEPTAVLALAAVFGASAARRCCTGVAWLAPPAGQPGIVMGGYSTALYLGLALGHSPSAP